MFYAGVLFLPVLHVELLEYLLRILISLLLLQISCYSFAGNTNHVGVIKEVIFFAKNWGAYSNNDGAVAAIYMEPALPRACGTGDYRVVIDVDHPLYQSVVSAALAAKVSQMPVRLNYLSTCSVRGNSWDFGYLHLK